MNEYPHWFVEFIDYCILEMRLPEVETYLTTLDYKLWKRDCAIRNVDGNDVVSILESVRWSVCVSIWKQEMHLREDFGGVCTRSVNLVQALKNISLVSTNDPAYWTEHFLNEFIELL
jgi:hypothetical protein